VDRSQLFPIHGEVPAEGWGWGGREGLIDFANRFRQPRAPGVEVIETARYRITLQPDYPVAGPNGVSWIRCQPDEVDGVIDEVRAIFAGRRLPLLWILDPETEPRDFADQLARRHVMPEPHAPEVAVMVLASDAPVDVAPAVGIAIRDALADAESFRSADAVNAEAFGEPPRGASPEQVAAQERRRQNQIAAGNRRVVLATVDGQPAGSAGLTLYPSLGAIINGGAVRERFRGRGVYRAMVAARLAMAREAGAPGISVWGGPMSAPILSKLGFEKVGWRRFYLDPTGG
jgi:RimJ/RimL family protein N-acetyltransferase